MSIHLTVGDRDLSEHVADLGYSTADPGGFEACSFQIPEQITPPSPGEIITIRDGLQLVWQGSVEEPGADYQQGAAPHQVQGVGLQQALSEGPGVAAVFIDQDLGAWKPPSAQRKLTLSSTYRLVEDHRITVDETNGDPGLVLGFGDSWADPRPVCEAAYDAGEHCAIGLFRVGDVTYSADVGAPDGVNWLSKLYLSASDAIAPVTHGSSGAHLTQGNDHYVPSTAVPLSFGNGKRVALIQFLHDASNTGVNGRRYEMTVRDVTILGDHGLTNHFQTNVVAGGNTSKMALWTAQIARWTVERAATLMVTQGGTAITFRPGSIGPDTDSGETLQSVYREPTAPRQILDDMAALSGWHWGVWEAPGEMLPAFGGTSIVARVDYLPPPTEETAAVSVRDCQAVGIAERLSDSHSAVLVRYQSVDGTAHATRVAVPNARVPSGRYREKQVDMGLGTSNSAEAYGRILLALEQQQARAAGSVQLPLTIQTANGLKPAQYLRAGLDRLAIRDLPNAGSMLAQDTRRFDTFRIARTNVTVDAQGKSTTTVELDAGANLLDVLNARLANAVTG